MGATGAGEAIACVVLDDPRDVHVKMLVHSFERFQNFSNLERDTLRTLLGTVDSW